MKTGQTEAGVCSSDHERESESKMGPKAIGMDYRRAKDGYDCGKAMMIESSGRIRYSSLFR